jgi:NADH:ubiquinone oxidoreductase subunit E
MTVFSNQDIIQQWRDLPAPLLPMLHAFHERDGFVSEEAMREVSKALRIPLADLFGTVTFYHHLSRRSPQKSRARVCTGPICCLKGGVEILNELKESGVPFRHRILVTRRSASLRSFENQADRPCLVIARPVGMRR